MLKLNSYMKYLLFVVSIIFIFVGTLRKEHLVVLEKAINICLECIGLG